MLNRSLHRMTAYVSVRSLEGNLFGSDAMVSHETIEQYKSSEQDTRGARSRIEEMGFTLERVSPLSMRISAPSEVFQNKLGLEFERRVLDQQPGVEEGGVPEPWGPTADSATKLMDTGIDVIEGIVFPQPISLHQRPNEDPPNPQYHHLKAPGDIVSHLNVGPVHAAGFRGQGVRAAMIDSGFHWSHPYFRARGYTARVALQPHGIYQDENGHGTGESANLFAVAPEVELQGVAMDDIIEAFEVCRDDLGVQIISNSWGSFWPTDGRNGTWDPYWSLVEAEIALCVQQGIVVLFSGGNGGMSFTASMPETISVGGVYVDENGDMQASNYASSFRSTRYPGEKVPEICGLVGMRPKAIYITLPVPPRLRNRQR